MSARQEKVRRALTEGSWESFRHDELQEAWTEVEEWEARLTAVAQAWFDFDQEALDTLLGPFDPADQETT